MRLVNGADELGLARRDSTSHDSTRTVELLYSAPASLVRTYGVDGASLAYGMARWLSNQKRAMARGSKFQAGGHPIINFSIKDMARRYPWIHRETYRRHLRALARDGIISVQDSPDGRYRKDTVLEKLVRNPDAYLMKPEEIKKVMAGPFVHFYVSDAVRFGNSTDAAVLNHVQAMAELARREDSRDWLVLAPKELESALGIKASTIRDSLARLVAKGILERLKGTPLHRLLETNPLREKVIAGSVDRSFTAPVGVSPMEDQAALVEMIEDVCYWYQDVSKLAALPEDALHFKKAGEICYRRGYNPYHFVLCNLGEGKKNKEVAFLHGHSCEAKYLNYYPSENAAYEMEYTRKYLHDRIKHERWRVSWYLEKYPDTTLDQALLSPALGLPLWAKLLLCSPDSAIYSDVRERHYDEARRELQKEKLKMLEAVRELEQNGCYPGNLRPAVAVDALALAS